MDKHSDFDVSFFKKAWPRGFVTSTISLVNIGLDVSKVYNRCIYPYLSQSSQALELGPGGGFWSKMLLHEFGTCWFVDVIEPPPAFIEWCGDPTGYNDVRWITHPVAQYDVTGVPNDSINYVWCFGLFCHLSRSARGTYLKAMKPALRPSCQCFVMFADWKRHPDYGKLANASAYAERSPYNWFYDTVELSVQDVKDAGYDIVDPNIYPSARDTIMNFTIPCRD